MANSRTYFIMANVSFTYSLVPATLLERRGLSSVPNPEHDPENPESPEVIPWAPTYRDLLEHLYKNEGTRKFTAEGVDYVMFSVHGISGKDLEDIRASAQEHGNGLDALVYTLEECKAILRNYTPVEDL
jgi:hypothetical protein